MAEARMAVSRWKQVLRDPSVAVPVLMFGCVIAGALVGFVWALVAPRPGYVVGQDLGASIGERGLSQIFGADLLYCQLVSVLGLLAGVAAWLLCRNLGVWVCLLSVAGAFLAGVSMWQFGTLVGRGGFHERLAAAGPGDVVPVDLQLHSLAALMVAPFFASLALMLLSAFWPERRRRSPVPDTDAATIAET